jgi:hypothetical protein
MHYRTDEIVQLITLSSMRLLFLYEAVFALQWDAPSWSNITRITQFSLDSQDKYAYLLLYDALSNWDRIDLHNLVHGVKGLLTHRHTFKKELLFSRQNYLFFKWGTTTGPPIFDGCQEGKERRDVGWMEALRPPFLLPQPNGWILVRPSVATFLFRNFRNYFQNFSSERSSELQLRS